jgi:hypothetical protein
MTARECHTEKDTIMTKIHSDAEFKAALAELSSQQQRAVGRLFVENVLALSDNPKVGKALGTGDPGDLTAEDIAEGFRAAKSAAIESYTLCGHEGDWLKQASHFVAAAAAACLTPSDQATQCKDLAWSTAMNARMARVCENVAQGKGTDESETQKQYAILEGYLQTA